MENVQTTSASAMELQWQLSLFVSRVQEQRLRSATRSLMLALRSVICQANPAVLNFAIQASVAGVARHAWMTTTLIHVMAVAQAIKMSAAVVAVPKEIHVVVMSVVRQATSV